LMSKSGTLRVWVPAPVVDGKMKKACTFDAKIGVEPCHKFATFDFLFQLWVKYEKL